MEMLQEYVMEFLVAVVIALGAFAWNKLQKHVFKPMKDEKDLNVIQELALHGAEWAESTFAGENGSKKFEEAFVHASGLLENFGVDVNEDTLRSAVQDAWHNMIEIESKEEKGDSDEDQKEE